MTTNSNDFLVCDWMRNDLKLSGTELFIYALIFDSYLQGNGITLKQIGEWLDIKERQEINILNELITKGLVTKSRQGRTMVYKPCEKVMISATDCSIAVLQYCSLEKKSTKRKEIYKEDYPISLSIIKENEDRDKDIDCTSNNTEDIKSKGVDNKSNKDIQKEKTNRFIPPTVEEVAAYCKERDNGVDAENFVDFYSAKDWFIGKNKMKDWKAAVRTWEKRDGNKKKPVDRITELDDIF